MAAAYVANIRHMFGLISQKERLRISSYKNIIYKGFGNPCWRRSRVRGVKSEITILNFAFQTTTRKMNRQQSNPTKRSWNWDDAVIRVVYINLLGTREWKIPTYGSTNMTQRFLHSSSEHTPQETVEVSEKRSWSFEWLFGGGLLKHPIVSVTGVPSHWISPQTSLWSDFPSISAILASGNSVFISHSFSILPTTLSRLSRHQACFNKNSARQDATIDFGQSRWKRYVDSWWISSDLRRTLFAHSNSQLQDTRYTTYWYKSIGL